MAFPSPSVSVPTLTAWQSSYASLTFGGAGTPYNLIDIDGVAMPVLRTGDAPRPRDQGMFIGLDLLPGREITFTGQFVQDDTSFQHAWNALATATVPAGVTESPLFLNVPGYGTLVTMARPARRDMKIDYTLANAGLANFALQFHCADPRWYSTPTLQSSVGLPSQTAGFSFPLGFPLAFGSGTVAGVITATNNGNISMRPVLVVTGPCTYPSMTNASATGSPTLQFGVAMAAGDTLVIDTDMKTATYFTSGSVVGSSRLSSIQPGSTWWSLAPGANTIQFLSQDGGPVAGTLAVNYASAYLL